MLLVLFKLGFAVLATIVQVLYSTLPLSRLFVYATQSYVLIALLVFVFTTFGSHGTHLGVWTALFLTTLACIAYAPLGHTGTHTAPAT